MLTGVKLRLILIQEKKRKLILAKLIINYIYKQFTLNS